MAELMRTYDGMGLYAARTDCDKEGNDLTLGIEGEIEFLQDENGDYILDDNGNPIANAESDAMVRTIGYLDIHAAMANTDRVGNDIYDTYATKSSVIPDSPSGQGVSPYIAWGRSQGTWVNARAIPVVSVEASSSVIMVNNALNVITGTTPATMTLAGTSDTVEAVNFAAQITPSVNCTITVTANGNSTKFTTSTGNILEAGKTYQISCLNDCWTMATFETPT